MKGKDTRPELFVRKLVYHLGFGYRLHDPRLPGKPDLVFRKTRKVIFVHGCFWHRHQCRNGRANPKTNNEFWQKKLGANVSRDRRNRTALKKDGWKVLVVWECQTVEARRGWLQDKLGKFLGPQPSPQGTQR
ncbi:MAG: DNA mismatch endonuclease Vsr [Acidobacteria bacterium]|nr:DNA mismatch endonuclease Vsr [Acidobacteriota bacterium]